MTYWTGKKGILAFTHEDLQACVSRGEDRDVATYCAFASDLGIGIGNWPTALKFPNGQVLLPVTAGGDGVKYKDGDVTFFVIND